LYYLLFAILVIWVFLTNNLKNNSIYNLNDKEFVLKITNMKIKDNKVTLYLDGMEKLVGTYYLKEGEECIFRYGELIRVKGALRIPSNNTIPHTFNYKKYLEHQGIYYTLKINSFSKVREDRGLYRIKNWLVKRVDSIDQTGYMKAFILGDKSLIDDEDYSNYQHIGVTHLFAISGMHIGLLSEILIFLLKKLKTGLKYIIIDILLIVYGFIVCFPASILRCITFYVLNSINKVFKLELESKQVLLLTIFILVFLNYRIIYDVGFWFSVCTVGGIILCNSFINDSNKLYSSFKLSLIAFLFSLPISLYSFYEINVLSIFYNLFFIPFISLIVYPLSLFTFLFPFLKGLFSLSISLLNFISSNLVNLKFFNIYMSFDLVEVLLFYLFLYIVFVKQHYKFFCLLFLIIFFDKLVPYLDSSSYIYFLDVNQGDSTLIIDSHRKNVSLIDTGGFVDMDISGRYIPLLKYLGIKKIDNLILTHGDFDHMGEADKIINSFKVNKVIFNCGPYNDLERNLIKQLDLKKINYNACVSRLDNFSFLHTKEFDNENDNSNVVFIKFGEYKFLFMGDASITTEKELIRSYNLANIDILKVGHHGSRTSSGKEFLTVINPKHSIISVGKYNKYGHPNKEVLYNLNDSKIYRTDKDGSIMFEINNNNELNIDTFRP